MKQSSTIENEIAMMINLLVEMVEIKCITQSQMEEIMDQLFQQYKNNAPRKLPGENVVKSIMNYSKALNVLKANDKKTFALIAN
jgi:hypothetical protein